MESKNANEIISNYLKNKSSILFLMLDYSKKIVEANNYAKRLLGDNILGKSIDEVFLDFAKYINLKNFTDDESFHMISVNTVYDFPETFYFSFYSCGKDILIFGEIPYSELENLRKDLLVANNELNNLARELHKKISKKQV